MRVVQVGLGGFGRSWAELARAAEGVDLVGAVDPVPEARAWAGRALGLPASALFADLDAALAAVSPEAVLLITPPETHHPLGLRALAAGKHVLMEKPLATSLGAGRELIAAAAAAGRVLMVSQNYRFRSPARAAQSVVAAGVLGELRHVHVVFRRDTRALFGAGNFRYGMAHPLIIDMAIHHVDLLRMLTGQEATGVAARGWRGPDSPYRHDPAVAALIQLSGGASVLYQGDWAPHAADTSWNGDWEIVGELGVLRWTGGVGDPLTGAVSIQRWGKPPRPVPQPALLHADRAGSLQAFRAAVETGAEPETSGRDNLGSLAIVLAMAAAVERPGLDAPVSPVAGLPG